MQAICLDDSFSTSQYSHFGKAESFVTARVHEDALTKWLDQSPSLFKGEAELFLADELIGSEYCKNRENISSRFIARNLHGAMLHCETLSRSELIVRIDESYETTNSLNVISDLSRFKVKAILEQVNAKARKNKKAAANMLMDKVEQRISENKFDEINAILRDIDFSLAGEYSAACVILATHRCLQRIDREVWVGAKKSAESVLKKNGHDPDEVFIGV